jgi:hypothetical protein
MVRRATFDEMDAMDRMDYMDVCQSYIVGGLFGSWGAGVVL